MQPTRAQVVPYAPPSIRTTLSVHALAARKALMPAEPAPITATSTSRSFHAVFCLSWPDKSQSNRPLFSALTRSSLHVEQPGYLGGRGHFPWKQRWIVWSVRSGRPYSGRLPAGFLKLTKRRYQHDHYHSNQIMRPKTNALIGSVRLKRLGLQVSQRAQRQAAS